MSVSQVSRLLGQAAKDRIGNTPLLRFDRVTSQFDELQILAKAEWHNPGGSVKDRAASRILAEALREGSLSSGRILLDSTSGNTGIAYAMLSAVYGFPLLLCMPSNVSSERKQILNAYGANIIYTDPSEGSDGAIIEARELHQRHPEKYFYADQYSNEANWRAHYFHGTADEIWRQTEGQVTHFVATLGTSGTFVGTARRLKELNPRILCTSVQPNSPFHGIEGAKYMATSIVPKIYDSSVADNELEVSTEDAHEMTRRLAREEGLLVGVSGAAALVGSIEVAKSARPGSVIVTIFADSGDKYLSERFWNDAPSTRAR